MARLEHLGGLWIWFRVQVFRLWTALFVLGAYAYFWLNEPEYLTWWKRAIDALIEKSCALLPYPWGDRVESTIGDFGLWVQITLTILLFRILVGGFIHAFRRNTYQSAVPLRPVKRAVIPRDGVSPPSSPPPPEAL